jgi:transposase
VHAAGYFHAAESVDGVESTMVRPQLDERQWARVEALLESERGPGHPPKDNRRFIEAVLWWRRTGVPWRDLPDEFGPWKTVFNRFDRWSKRGRWDRLFRALRSDIDAEWHSIDSTINRAHQHAAGAKGGGSKGSGVHAEGYRRRCT